MGDIKRTTKQDHRSEKSKQAEREEITVSEKTNIEVDEQGVWKFLSLVLGCATAIVLALIFSYCTLPAVAEIVKLFA